MQSKYLETSVGLLFCVDKMQCCVNNLLRVIARNILLTASQTVV